MTPVPRPLSPVPCPITFSHVSKHFRIGSHHDSLRDAIPALLKRLTHRNGHATPAEVFWALKDVSFEVKKGETLGIVGPNGAGKSTILKLLSRISRQTKGTLKVRGRMAALIELGGGFHPDLTGSENIYLQGTMLGFSRRQVKQLYDSIVAFSELEQFLETPVKRYSSGMIVRLGFAIAAHIQPEVLLIDEVLAVGDLSFQQKCYRRIRELKVQGTTMIFISHDLEVVQKLCDRIILMQRGQIVREGPPAQMIGQYRDEVLSNTLKASTEPLEEQDGPVSITSLSLHDAQGQPVETLKTGDALRVEVSVRAKRPIHHPVFRVAIERLDDLLCHAAFSKHSGLAMEEINGEATITLDYPAVNLLPNLYQVTVELFDQDSSIPLAAVRDRCYFQVTSDDHEHGTVHLEHCWGLQSGGGGLK